MSNENGNTGGKLYTGMCRLAFVSVFEPKNQPCKPGETPKKKYEVTLLVPKNDTATLNPLKKLAYDAIVKKWGTDKAKWPGNLRALDLRTFLSVGGKDGWPFRDGDAMGYDGFPGNVSIKCSSDPEHKPIVVDAQKNPILDKSEVYSGCYGHALITAYGWEHAQGGKGVSFSLLGIQKRKDGEPFTTRASMDDFSAYDEMADNMNGYVDDDIPF